MASRPIRVERTKLRPLMVEESKLHATGKSLVLGKRRLAFAGFPGDPKEVKVVTGRGFILIYPISTRLCSCCAHKLETPPDDLTLVYCDICQERDSELISR